MADIDRRTATKLILLGGAAAAAGCRTPSASPTPGTATAVGAVTPLGFPWEASDPFIVCMYHLDAYPRGDERMGPVASLEGRMMGRDFAGKDGWRMYHGEVVPGFPRHPHRGFETVTVVRTGLLDHSDSLGATARYGNGDVQWLTAGRGIQHAEMFPLLKRDADNPLDLYQIWLNLPAADKFAEPHFAMLWDEKIPRLVERDEAGGTTELTVVAGRYADRTAAPPPPSSWASRADTDVAIWTLKLAPGARFTMPPVAAGSQRNLYFHRGSSISVAGRTVAANNRIEIAGEGALRLEAGPDECELLLLQGRPIGEPVVKHGPFVMNTRAEIEQAYADYRATRFGDWRWGSADPVHARDKGRFALRPDGSMETPA